MKSLIMAVLVFGSCLTAFADADEGEVRKRYMQGVMALANSDLDASEKHFLAVAEAGESREFNVKDYRAKAYYFLGDIQFIRQKNEQAVRYYRTVTDKYYNEEIYSKALYKLGRTLVVDGRYQQGVEILKDYLTRYQNADAFADNAYYWMAQGFIGLRDYQPALSAYQLILQKFPSSSLAYDVRASVDSLERLIAEQDRAGMKSSARGGEAETAAQKREKMAREKDLLEKMSSLLKIKQRLLDIKSEKVELLKALKSRNRTEY